MDIQKIIHWLSCGNLIAYPTEAVYGLGCDPFNETAVQKLLKLKQRSVHKGLILITHEWECVADLTLSISKIRLAEIQKTWPGPYTWVFPASDKVPHWIRGRHNTIALRVTAHPVAAKICEAYGKPLVSTSANLTNMEAARNSADVKRIFGDDESLWMVEGEVGDLAKPTTIADAVTGERLR